MRFARDLDRRLVVPHFWHSCDAGVKCDGDSTAPSLRLRVKRSDRIRTTFNAGRRSALVLVSASGWMTRRLA